MKRILLMLIAPIILLTGCTREAAPPAPSPTVQELPTAMPTPTPSADPLAVPNGCYTIGWISDTQHYSAKFPQTFLDMTAFLAENQAKMNLGYVVHTGDLVHNYDDPAQWEVADRALTALDAIPHGVLAGNHDYNSKNGGYAEYAAYFGEARYAQKPWYGGSYEDNRCHYDRVTLGETDYLFIYLSYLPDSGCVKWANEIFAQYPDAIGVLCVHDYFTTLTERSTDGEMLFEKIVTKNPNLYLVLCGHRYALYAEDTVIEQDGAPARTVHQVMANYQAAGNCGGSGYLRLMQIDEANGTIKMRSYSPCTQDFTYFDTPEHLAEKYPSDAQYEEYEIDIPWKG